MSGNVKTIVIALVALVVGAVGGAGYGMMQADELTQKLVAMTQEKDQAVQATDHLRKMNDEAVRTYGTNLGKMVAGVPAGDDPAKLTDSARAILAARDGFRGSLDGARAAMNSEFDELAAELGNSAPNPEKIKQLLDGLKQNWPAKEKGLDDASRKLLVDLGVLKGSPAPAPAAAPAAAPPATAPAEKK
jgi:hypothetical protein